MTAVLMVARRSSLRVLRTPQILAMATVQQVAFLLIFRYVFGGAISTGSLRYVDYMVPGILTVGVLFAGLGGAVAAAVEMQEGFTDRLLSLPIPRAAIAAGRVVADTLMCAWCLLLPAALAFAVGFRVRAGWGGAAAAFGLCLLFGFAFAWVFLSLGMLTGNPQAAQGIGFIVLPLSFASSAYVPVATMPGWLQAFAARQPVTIMINAVRTLTQGPAAETLLGHSAGYYVVRSVLWAGGIAGAFAIIAIAKIRRR